MSRHVVVVGAGPSGLVLAAELRLGGVACTVVDRCPGPPRASGGMLMHARTAQYFHSRGLADRLGLDAAPLWPRTHFAFFYLDPREVSPACVDIVFPQWRLVSALEGWARELGATILRDASFAGLEQDGQQVMVRLSGPAGDIMLSADYLVGCDGVHSAVADAAGFGFDVLAPPGYGLIGDFPAAELPPSVGQFRAGNYAGGQFGVLPVNPADPQELRLMTVENDRSGPPPQVPVTVAELAAAIARITGEAVRLPEPRWLTRFGSATRIARELQRGRVFLCGDAAHAHMPSSGNGLNTAVHDAANLGWKLAAKVCGYAPAGLLDSYQSERLPVARKVCTRAAAQLPLMEPAERAAPLRAIFAELIRLPDVARYLVEYTTEITYPVDDGEQAGAGAGPAAGTLLPPAVARAVPLDGGRGALLCVGVPQAWPVGLRGWSDRLTAARAGTGGEEDAWLPDGRYLVRPDGYLAWAEPARSRDDHALLRAVRAWFGEPSPAERDPSHDDRPATPSAEAGGATMRGGPVD